MHRQYIKSSWLVISATGPPTEQPTRPDPDITEAGTGIDVFSLLPPLPLYHPNRRLFLLPAFCFLTSIGTTCFSQHQNQEKKLHHVCRQPRPAVSIEAASRSSPPDGSRLLRSGPLGLRRRSRLCCCLCCRLCFCDSTLEFTTKQLFNLCFKTVWCARHGLPIPRVRS